MEEKKQVINYTEGDEGTKEPDTCRICRGEGDPAESLFHPCKCSGSIKFVHQDCLMEWLSHSQKKHCELCKTAFRFTKLYSPDMPQSLPLRILIRHVLKHSLKVILTLIRLCLVMMVWLGLLPYTIRQVWRFLFWLSEGGWPPNELTTSHNSSSNMTLEPQVARQIELSTLIKNGVNHETLISTNITNPIYIRSVVDRLAQFLIPVSHALRISGPDDIATSLFKSIYNGIGIQGSARNDIPISKSCMFVRSKGSSLLSDVSFFKNLTQNSSFNQLLINITEGYIITVLVVVCFVLVFLIREWVVQQQPGMNIGVDFNAELAPNERPRDDLRDPEAPTDIQGEIDLVNEDRQIPLGNGMQPNLDVQVSNRAKDIGNNQSESSSDVPVPVSATGVQKSITDEPWITSEFLDMWDRADGNRKEFMRILESDGKLDQLTGWLNSMEAFENMSEVRRQAIMSTKPAFTSSMLIEEASEKLSKKTDRFKQSQAHNIEDQPSGVTYYSALTQSSRIETDFPLPKHDSVIHSNFSDIGFSFDKNKGKSHANDHKVTKPVQAKYEDTDGNTVEDLPHRNSIFSSSKYPQNNCIGSSSSSWPISDSPKSITSFPLTSNTWSFPKELIDDENDKLKLTDKVTIKKDSRISIGGSGDAEKFGAVDDLAIEREINIAVETSNNLRSHKMLNREQEACQHWAQHHVLDKLMGKNETDTEEQDKISINESTLITETCIDTNVNINEQNDLPPPSINSSQIDDPSIVKVVPQTILGSVTEYLWGEVDDRSNGFLEANNEGTTRDSEVEILPALATNNENLNIENNAEVVPRAVQLNNIEGMNLDDPEIIEEAEDFEGIMELLGMRGPIFGLVQNALFSALLLGLTITVGVWFPYNIGRVSLLLLANPGPTLKVPLRILFGCAAFTQDIALSILGLSSSIFIQLLAQPYNLWTSYFGPEKSFICSQTNFLASTAMGVSSAAFKRFKGDAINNLMFIMDSEMSAACHESLITIQSLLSTLFTKLGAVIIYLFSINYSTIRGSIAMATKFSTTNGVQILKSLPGWLFRSNIWTINLDQKKRTAPIDLELSTWSGIDRFIAIATGYIALCALGTIYVKKRSPLLVGQAGRELEIAIIDLLRQAGGVMKVILIISIEMLAFPLYCGLLLDISLLPLFENTTILSRIVFTLRSPLTSIFVHWFVGTCYMFHFALFVSMCRKIMRKGVLYFIRDPDDPTFHPVRDVLERNVTTQLQKILFSALVYGALILICLGGVVWGISFSLKGVLPVYWSSNEPVLEFPVDLLFYNFLIPFAVKFFRPSAKLHAMYSWWFRKCARTLRLTWFMFDERVLDEERRLVRKSWLDYFRKNKADPNSLVISGNPKDVFEQNPDIRVYYFRDGCYVRAPASDQVRIPKDSSIFLEVNEWNERIDQKPDRKDGIHGKESDLCKLVYIPPWFRVRISIFIISIWIYAAITGVGVTIIPLVVGRIVFSNVLPPQVRKNDAYAFSIGIYILGSVIYCAFNFNSLLKHIRKTLVFDANTPKKLINYVFSICSRVFRITWTYTAFLIVLPTLFAFLIEFYLIVPLHTYLAIEEKHVVHFVQSWTLGLLYVKLTARLILWFEDSRPAQLLRAVTRNGYLNPDARVATRSFIVPGAFLLSAALFYPWAIARLTILTLLQRSPEKHTLAYRYSYPICLCFCFLAIVSWILTGWVRNWKIKIRNEIYLIGEQLHNYGERKL